MHKQGLLLHSIFIFFHYTGKVRKKFKIVTVLLTGYLLFQGALSIMMLIEIESINKKER